ncbi:MAG: transporter substrate-binding domain-containing protein [Clostridia bacterium]|nr:transporter substrate-binding domain-containing protein [Clostridia bacterium]
MKKLLTLLLTVAMICTSLLFTACGGREKVDISTAKTIHDLKGASIAAQSATFHLEVLSQVEGIKISDYEDFPALLIALNSGVIDGYVAEEPTAYAECLRNPNLAYLPFVNNDTGFTAGPTDTGIAVAFATGSPMVAQVNQVLATISEDTKKTLMEQAVEMSINKNTALGENLALVSSNTNTSNGTLKIAMECGYDPFNWTQTSNVNGAVVIANGTSGATLYANGYDVQVAKYIAAELGMALEIYQYEWNSLIPAVQTGAVDGIIAGMSPTAERELEVDFTNCYYLSNLVVIYKKA